MALEPPQIQASADNAAQATLKVAELLKKVDLKELAELFGADPNSIPENNFAGESTWEHDFFIFSRLGEQK